jgi:hypothetical protein
MSERTDADKLAHRLLDEPFFWVCPLADPDDDLRMLSRQLLRRREVIERLEKRLMELSDDTADLINANRDTILRITEEGLRRVERLLLRHGGIPDVTKALLVIEAVNMFHPMHGESWCGWPK